MSHGGQLVLAKYVVRLDVHGMLVNVEPLALVKNYAYISAHKFMIINLDIKYP